MTHPPQPGEPQYQHIGAPPPGPVAPPKKSNRTLLIIFGVAGAVFIACCGIGAIAMMSSDTPTENTAADKPNAVAPAQDQPIPTKGDDEVPTEAKIGTPVRDGKFEFTVKSVKCGVAKVGESFLEEKAQGQFCLVNVHVKNIGDEARMFHAGNQHAYGAGNVKYDAHGTASMYANKDREAFLTDINPGNSITANVVFDIPKDGKLLKLELHDSPFSGGVEVRLA